MTLTPYLNMDDWDAVTMATKCISMPKYVYYVIKLIMCFEIKGISNYLNSTSKIDRNTCKLIFLSYPVEYCTFQIDCINVVMKLS